MDADEDRRESHWAIWGLLIAVATAILVGITGCDSSTEVKIVTQEEKSQLDAKELYLPPDAKNVHKINNEWHTFELMIDGRTRKFLRRFYAPGWESSTDAFTELKPQ